MLNNRKEMKSKSYQKLLLELSNFNQILLMIRFLNIDFKKNKIMIIRYNFIVVFVNDMNIFFFNSKFIYLLTYLVPVKIFAIFIYIVDHDLLNDDDFFYLKFCFKIF